MSDHATALYPTDVAKAMQLLGQHKISDADAVVGAFTEVRDDATRKETHHVTAWLRKQPCPTPGSWTALIEALERGEHRP